MKRSSPKRPGSALVLSIVVLTVVTAVLGALLKMQILRQSQLVRREWQLQAQCLTESAFERASQQLQQDQEYPGETWQVDLPESTIGRAAAEIQVQAGESAETLAITVVSRVPDHPQHRAQLTTTRTFTFASKSFVP